VGHQRSGAVGAESRLNTLVTVGGLALTTLHT
jgi:hypothetical protein